MSKIKISICPECKGRGDRPVVASNGVLIDRKPCTECKGTGKIVK